MAKKPSLASTLKKRTVKSKKPKTAEPLWKGPEVDGVTQSMLSRFLVCRERFRVAVIEGLQPADDFNHRIEYGNMWHLCEEYVDGDWTGMLKRYAMALAKRYPLRSEEVTKWWRVCQLQFPLYVEYWRKHRDQKAKANIYSEETFCEEYPLPSGRVVKLRGKWDSVDSIGRNVWLQENKTKGDIDEQSVQRQLMFDLQTMIYLVALQLRMDRDTRLPDSMRIAGVRYNVVRRPLSGGKGTIRQHQATKNKPAETADEFYGRLAVIIGESPESFFMRWDVTVSADDLERFKTRFLTPILEQLCIWYEFVTGPDPFFRDQMIHWQFPYGVWNPMTEGKASEVDEYLMTGSKLGLVRRDRLFEELEDADSE